MKTREYILFAVLGAVIGILLARWLFPRETRVTVPVPQIVTVYDTVRDTVRLEGPTVVTTDTVELVIRQTFHDTVQINVACEPEERPNIFPILNAEIGEKRGDTSVVRTFSLRTGNPISSQIWTPGPLRSIWADSTGTPRMDFYAPPAPKGVSFWTKLQWSLTGYGACEAVRGVTNLLRPGN